MKQEVDRLYSGPVSASIVINGDKDQQSSTVRATPYSDYDVNGAVPM